MKPWQCKKGFLILLTLAVTAAGQPPALEQEPPRPRTVADSSLEAQSPGAVGELVRRLTADEQAALNRPEDPRGRVKTYVRLAQARLRQAREALNREDYTGSDEQLAAYTLLVTEAGRFLAASVPARDKANKTLEQALREQIRVLEGIRRDVTAAHVEPSEQALAIANRVRRQSLNALLGDGKLLLKEPEPDPSQKPPEGQPR